MVVELRSVPLRRRDLILSSSAVPILLSSSLVHPFISASPLCDPGHVSITSAYLDVQGNQATVQVWECMSIQVR
jgi:hypothetical protein